MTRTFLSHGKLRNRIKGLVDSNADKIWLKTISNARKIRRAFVSKSIKIVPAATRLSTGKSLHCRLGVKDFR
ncbi:UNVERIFIED_ORG: methionine synthase I (cobalamin-dependent) [Rhizobium aethiopicum]|uniref:hypothetical protein n=1 Tax=unclassified Rhizobium TaxID=2613769 RepID=UPI000FE10CD9|nr:MULTISPECIES: hypothetical protein [unclassified Rhizobium]RVU11854.1 hypothetical protein EOS93_09290 [Rhizobium sp. RMa-01]